MYSNFADIIKYVNLYLKDKNVTFHHEIYDNIKTITNNFETNLTCKDLQDNGLNINHLNYLAYYYCQVNKNTFFLTLWPIVNRNYEGIIMKYYNDNNCKIIFKKDLQLNDNGCKNILNHISKKRKHPNGLDLWFGKPYRYENPLTIFLIEVIKPLDAERDTIKKYLTKIFNNDSEYINNVEKLHGYRALENLYTLTKKKRQCRLELSQNNLVPKLLNERKSYNYSHHINDFHSETPDLGKLYLNNNNLFYLNNKGVGYDNFNQLFHRFKIWADSKKSDNYCIDNSSVLAVFNIRASRDLDYLHSTNLHIRPQIPEDMISSHNFVIKKLNLDLTINDIVYNPINHFYHYGIKFCTLDILKKVKKKQSTLKNRKAINDLKLLYNFLHVK